MYGQKMNLRITDPTIACTQYVSPGETVEITVKYSYWTGSDSWRMNLSHAFFIGYSLSPEITSVSGPWRGTYRLVCRIPMAAELGLYDLEIFCTQGLTTLRSLEYHAIMVYNTSQLTEELRFVHFGDTHVNYNNASSIVNIAPPGQPEKLEIIGRNENFRRALTEICTIQPDFIMITGDVSDTGRETEFLEIREILRESSVPIFTSIGNHEYRSPPSYEYYLAPRYYARSIGPWRIIILDTGASEGNGLFGEQMVWYEQQLQLATQNQQQVMVGMHAPSTTQGIAGYAIQGNAEFRMLNRRYNVTAVFTGHHHEFGLENAEGNLITQDDPLSGTDRPYYVKTSSPNLVYGQEYHQYHGWRYVRCRADGTIAMGYNYDGIAGAEAVMGFPRNGFNKTMTITDENVIISITNWYNFSFSQVTIPIELENMTQNKIYGIAGGVINTRYWNGTALFLLILTDLNPIANTTIVLTPQNPLPSNYLSQMVCLK
jgi:predicted MPP superfamily phosphohydrolase